MTRRSVAGVLVLSLLPAISGSQDASRHAIVPIKTLPARLGSVEVLSGDPAKAGLPFVIRIHNDAGYVVLPHTHPEDENIVVVKGSWSLGMGRRFDPSALEPLEVGDYGFVPKKMAHFGRAQTELIIQVHGIGPFSTDFADPVYELSDTGVSLITTAGRPGPRVEPPTGCFVFKLGDRVSTARGSGTVIGALCSPASRFTQYRVETDAGGNSWATSQELEAKRR